MSRQQDGKSESGSSSCPLNVSAQTLEMDSSDENKEVTSNAGQVKRRKCNLAQLARQGSGIMDERDGLTPPLSVYSGAGDSDHHAAGDYIPRRELAKDAGYYMGLDESIPLGRIAEQNIHVPEAQLPLPQPELYIAPSDWSNVKTDSRRENVDVGTCNTVLLYDHDGVMRVWFRSTSHESLLDKILYVDSMVTFRFEELPLLLVDNVQTAWFGIIRAGLKASYEAIRVKEDTGKLILRGTLAEDSITFDIMDAMRATPEPDCFWVNAPDARHVARQCISIMDAFCDVKHHNGPAIGWGAGILDLALSLVKQDPTLREENYEMRTYAIPLGGGAYGSKYNTRVGIVGCLHEMQAGSSTESKYPQSPLHHPLFPYAEQPLVEWLKKRYREGKPITSTKVTHDSGAMAQECPIFVHEALSTNVREEECKIIAAITRMLSVQKVAYAMLSTSTFIIYYRGEIVTSLGTIRVGRCRVDYYSSTTAMADVYPESIADIIFTVAGILRNKEMNADTICMNHAYTDDHPQAGRNDFKIQKLKPFEASFTLDTDLAKYVEDGFLEEVVVKTYQNADKIRRNIQS